MKAKNQAVYLGYEFMAAGVLPLNEDFDGLSSEFQDITAVEQAGAVPRKQATLEERVNEAERRIIEECLQRHQYHRIRTARELGISRVTLYNKMKKFGMLDAQMWRNRE